MKEDDNVEEALRRQDEALALLERLRIAEPYTQNSGEQAGGGRRDFRRWPAPESMTAELHDGTQWHKISCSDFGVGGVRLTAVPAWLQGPAPVRVKGPTGPAILALGDIMWQDKNAGAAGLRFEFQDPEERDRWTAILIDALLARYALA